MYVQFCPAGQHMAAMMFDVVFSLMQLALPVQQKTGGNVSPQLVSDVSPPQSCPHLVALSVPSIGCISFSFVTYGPPGGPPGHVAVTES